MSHTPFILAAYGVATLLLLWGALAPVLRARKLKSEIRARLERTGD
ncbi:MAG: heme exporter protein CcmD [Xanthomonadales bacterium]|nr:heme exporter protein CcmD [Xanthomonadales bacterium]NIT46229.1 heme exporter protein CcmD [Stutzerimonas stutzeri]NIN59909.1 heme exporter protein CcmD [Xanthomonadales bacterium]NIN75283.1 heme exporter protein CcmD [Xanthomonadales bacterium]NIO15152.1 heme exporter protein CcmD [Xanthomonadales bacterium]